jgi:transposase
MGKALATDLRERAVASYESGDGTQEDVARLFRIGPATLGRWLRRKRLTGAVAPIVDYKHGPSPKIDIVQLDALETILETHRDSTNEELAELLFESTGMSVSPASISRAVAVLGWTRKKSLSSPSRPTPRVSAIFVKSGPAGSEM